MMRVFSSRPRCCPSLSSLRGGSVSDYPTLQKLIDKSFQINKYSYDSFGKQITSSGSLANPFQYTARESGTETGLYYYRARYYDQSSGRFLSEDPIGFKGGTNFYEYGFNSPTISIDPTRLLPTPWHRNVTNDLARAVFGGKCADKAKAVANADAGVDSFGHGTGGGVIGTVKGFFQFMTNTGEAWAQPGPHFPTQGMLDQLHSKALNTCSLKDLGESLHSRQDAYGHSGWSSFGHYEDVRVLVDCSDSRCSAL